MFESLIPRGKMGRPEEIAWTEEISWTEISWTKFRGQNFVDRRSCHFHRSLVDKRF
jgi:hypothetical protein